MNSDANRGLCYRCARELAQTAIDLPADLSGVGAGSTAPGLVAHEVLRLRELFTDFVQRSPDLVFQTDDALRFTYVNDAWTTVLGYAPDDLLGHPMCDFQPPDSVERDWEVLRAATAGSVIRGHRSVRLHKDGHPVHVLLSARPIHGPDGALRGVRGTAVDISAQVRAWEEAGRARAADRAKSAFLAMMSHELRTPLSHILGFSGILLREISGPLTKDQRKQVGLMQSSARLLRQLVDDILDYVRLEGGALRPRRDDVDLGRLAARVVEMTLPRAASQGLRLTMATTAPAILARADAHRVEQILLNLVGNALKFTAEGGVHVALCRDGDAVCVSVADTGPGIPADQLDTIFEAFHQIYTDDARQDGAGLGLAISRGLARAMGGDLSVSSTVGGGSEFTLRLPADADADAMGYRA